MDTAMLIEIFGYIGSVLVVVSMLMSSVVKLRLINMAGSVISGTYALIIGSFPLALMNICLIIINVYNLYKLLKTEQKYDLAEGTSVDSFLSYFVDHYKQDICTYFPAFDVKDADVDRAYLVCCEGNPASVLLGKDAGDGTIEVILDYSTPTYRDCTAGSYLYAQLSAKGVKQLRFAQTCTETHTAYLTKMGFTKQDGSYVKNL